MINKAESGTEKKTRKKVTGVRGMCSYFADESTCPKSQIYTKGTKLGQAPSTVPTKTDSMLTKKYKCPKKVEALYEVSENSLQWMNYERKRYNSPKMSCCAKNLKYFLAPGEMKLSKTKTGQSGDGPIHANDDFLNILKNSPRTVSSETSNRVSVSSSQGYSEAILSNQHELRKKNANILDERCISKYDRTKNVFKSDIECLRDTDSRRRHNRRTPYGEEVAKKLGDTTKEQGTPSFSNSDESFKDLKLNELEKLDEEQLRQLYDHETSVNEPGGSSNSSSDSEKFKANSKLDTNYNLKYKAQNFRFSSDNEKSRSSHDRGFKSIWRKQHLGKKAFQLVSSDSKTFDWKQQEKEAMGYNSLARKKLEPRVMSLKHYKQDIAEPEANVCRKVDKEEMKSKTAGRQYVCQRKTEHKMSFGHYDSETVKTGTAGSRHLDQNQLESEVINHNGDNRKQSKPEIKLQHDDRNHLEPDMIWPKNPNRKLPASKTAGCQPAGFHHNFPFDSKSSSHLCHMLAKSLPNGNIISFDKLSEILPENELIKVNERIDKNVEDKQLLPSLCEDTQSHIDRIKEQILQKAKDCLPKATFSKINQFLSSNRSDLDQERVQLTPFLVPETETSAEVITSSDHQKSDQLSIRAASTHHIRRDASMKCGRKLSSSNSYYSHLYTVHGSKRRSGRSRKYRSENMLGAQPRGRSQNTLQKNSNSYKFDRKKNPNHCTSNEDILKVRYSNKYEREYTFDFYNLKMPRSGFESEDGLTEESIYKWSIDSEDTNLIFVEYDAEYLHSDCTVHSNCVSELYYENHNDFKTLSYQTQQRDDDDRKCSLQKAYHDPQFCLTACSCPLNSFEGFIDQPDLILSSQQNIYRNSDSCCELVLQKILPEGRDFNLYEPHNLCFEPSIKTCSCIAVYEAGNCRFEMHRCSCKNIDSFIKNSTLILSSLGSNNCKCPVKILTTNAHFHDFSSLIHESDLVNSWKCIQGPHFYSNENVELCNEKLDLFESCQNLPDQPSSFDNSSIQGEDKCCNRKYDTIDFSDYAENYQKLIHSKFYQNKSLRENSLKEPEFWHDIYEPAEADNSLNSQYCLYLLGKLLGSQIFESESEKFLIGDLNIYNTDVHIKSNEIIPEVPKFEFLNHPKIESEYNQTNSSCVNCLKKGSNCYRARPKSKYKSTVPSIYFGNYSFGTKKFQILHLYSNLNFKKINIGSGFKKESLSSIKHRKQTRTLRNRLKYVAHVFLKSGVNLKSKGVLDGSAISLFKRSIQQQIIKSQVTPYDLSNILVTVPGIAPVFTSSSSHLSYRSTSNSKITCHQTEISSSLVTDPTRRLFSETLSNLNIRLLPQLMQRINPHISSSQNASRSRDSNETKADLELYRNQYFESYLPVPQKNGVILENKQTSKAVFEYPLLKNVRTLETYASCHSFNRSNLKRFPDSISNVCSEHNPLPVLDDSRSNILEHSLEAMNFVKSNNFQLLNLITPSHGMAYWENSSIKDSELMPLCSTRRLLEKRIKIVHSLETMISELWTMFEPNVNLQSFNLNSKMGKFLFFEERLERAPKSGYQLTHDNVCQDIPIYCITRDVHEPHTQSFLYLKQGSNAYTNKIRFPKNELSCFCSIFEISKTVLVSNMFNSTTEHKSKKSNTQKLKSTYVRIKESSPESVGSCNSILDSRDPKNYDYLESFESSTSQSFPIQLLDIHQSEIFPIPKDSHNDRSIQSVTFCLPSASQSMSQETVCSSYFHPIKLLAEWYFEHVQKEIRNLSFLETVNNRKIVRLVDRTTQTDLCLTNSDLFDSFLLAHILSLDDSAENVTV